MKNYDVVILGAGPSGLFTAINIIPDKSVLILEKMEKPAKKLLISGSGRCNVTNTGSIKDFFNHYGDNSNFLKHSLNSFTNQDLIDFLDSQGMKTVIDKNGKVFPETQKASDILNILLNQCETKKIDLYINQEISRIKRSSNKFILKTQDEEYLCDYLVIATGGKSYPKTGSTGDGYQFAETLCHTIVEPKPALSHVKIKNYKFIDLAGVSLTDIEISLYRNNKKLRSHVGDIGFTHRGLTGPGIIDFSRFLDSGDLLKINFASRNSEELNKQFIEACQKEGKQSIKKFLKNLNLPERLIMSVLTEQQIKPEDQLATITRQLRNKLISSFCEFPFEIESVGNFEVAMVTTGGVSLKEISSKTMESKIVPHLYFVGEVLDIDGDTGGYNIQAAFSTGYVAAKSISSAN